VLQGNAIRKTQPVYPPIARATRVQGQVQIEVVIDVDGSVIQATMIDGHPLLRQSALEAAQHWKFRPTLLSGEPIKVTGILIFNFTL
jgi:protein TonB